MISGTVWIRRGAAAPQPERFQMTDEQYEDIMKRSQFEIEEAKESLKEAQITAAIGQDGSGEPSSFSASEGEDEPRKKGKKGKKAARSAAEATVAQDAQGMQDVGDVENDLAKFNLGAYDDDDHSDDAEEDILTAFSTIDAAALGEDDPYLGSSATMKGAAGEEEEDEDDGDDLRIRPTDNLLVACKTEDDVSYLEMYVYEEQDENLYVHHDLMLPAFPLCVEWIGAPLAGGQTTHGNFAAVGTFDPEIEVWNLDVLDVPLPSLTLGRQQAGGGKEEGVATKKKSKKLGHKIGEKSATRHTDSVMSLSWNRLHTSMLLSGSADTTVKLWDLTQAVALRSYDHHQDKVQALQWNPTEASVIASAAYDKRVFALDCRTPGDALVWNLLADPECVRWNPHKPTTFTVSDEEGRVMSFDMRAGANSQPLFTLAAHGKAVTLIDWNPVLPDCLLTASADKTIKLWNTRGEISCVAAREVGVGKIFAGSFCFDSPNLVAVAGSKGVLTVVNLLNDPTIIEGFKAQ